MKPTPGDRIERLVREKDEAREVLFDEGRAAYHSEAKIRMEMAYQAGVIFDKAEQIRDTMDRLMRRIENEGAAANLNTLGESQGAGAMLDNFIGRLAGLREALKAVQQSQPKEGGRC